MINLLQIRSYSFSGGHCSSDFTDCVKLSVYLDLRQAHRSTLSEDGFNSALMDPRVLSNEKPNKAGALSSSRELLKNEFPHAARFHCRNGSSNHPAKTLRRLLSSYEDLDRCSDFA